MGFTLFKKNILTAFLCSIFAVGYTQTPIVDSLKLKLKKATNDLKKLDILLSLFQNYSSYNADSLFSCVNQAEAILPKVTDNKK